MMQDGPLTASVSLPSPRPVALLVLSTMPTVSIALLTILPSFSLALLTVKTPSDAAVCSTVDLSWQGGIAPWLLSIVSSTPPNAAVETLGTTSDTIFGWTVDLTAGTSVILQVQDSAGDSAQSSPFTIQPGGVMLDGTCLAGKPVSAQVPPSTGSGSTSSSGAEPSTTHTGSGDGHTSSTSVTSTTTSTSSSVVSPPSSSPSPTPSPLPDPQSAAPFSSTVFSGLGSPSSDSGLGSITLALSEPTGGPEGPGITFSVTNALPSTSLSSAGTGHSATSDVLLAKKNVMSGSIIGGIIAAVLCVLVAVFCVIRRSRRRRRNERNRVVYPFSAANDAEALAPREMVGRSGYPASTFSSWGNQGDLTDEPAVSPTTEGHHRQWEAGQGTIESRYNAGFSPGHTASSSSIDRNDPTSQQRFRGPIPKSMTDTRHAGPPEPSPAIMEQQLGSACTPALIFDETRPPDLPTWAAVHEATGRHPVVGFPPPYTS
ncbi:hypothetical protein B0H11DRAFT_2083758, partial [Mycena galericulata]